MNNDIKQPKRKKDDLSDVLSVLLMKETIHQRCEATEMIHQQTGRKVSLSGGLSESELAELRKIPNVFDGDSICWENMIGWALANGKSLEEAKEYPPKYWLAWWRAEQEERLTAATEPDTSVKAGGREEPLPQPELVRIAGLSGLKAMQQPKARLLAKLRSQPDVWHNVNALGEGKKGNSAKSIKKHLHELREKRLSEVDLDGLLWRLGEAAFPDKGTTKRTTNH